jgi:mannose-6-phosphate isomerase-like protein (cupin superfamily)
VAAPTKEVVVAEPIVYGPGQGSRTLDFGGGMEGRTLNAPEDTANSYSIAEWTLVEDVPAPPLHSHSKISETVMILEGEIELTDGTQIIHGKPGVSVTVKPGTPHGFRKQLTKTVRLITVQSPADLSEKVYEAMEEASRLGDDLQKIMEVLAAADIQIIGA